ncbi:MAG: cytochrome c [Hyphomicrobiales bacterium]|nr:cytochrome c [Hyphomicrobiales bacterium]
MTLTRFASQTLLVGALALPFSASVDAQQHPGKPNPKRGAELAVKLCSNCHTTQADNAARVKADVPTFREIAALDDQTDVRITGKIMMPRHPMPSINLTRSELADVVAYIQSLKAPN